MYTEGFDQVDGSTTRAVTKEMAARGEVRYLGLHQHVSSLRARERMRIRRLPLCCVQNLIYIYSDAGLLPTHRLRTIHYISGTSGIQPVALVLLPLPIYRQKPYIIVEWAKTVQYIPYLQCFSSNLGIQTLANSNNPAVF